VHVESGPWNRTLPVEAVAVVPMAGDLDLARVDELRVTVGAALDAPGVRQVVVEMTDVAFIDSTAISMLMLLRARAQGQKISFCLAGLQPNVLRVLELTGVLEAFTVLEEPDHAGG
jgi:anti-sigma B factor antagonist